MSLARPPQLYTAAQVRELDRRAIEDHGVDDYALMTRAAAAALRCLRLRWPGARRLCVYCGGGNNGGDGIVLARLARAAGLEVALGLAGDPARLRGAAGRAWQDWDAPAAELHALRPAAADVVVDALLGTGLDRPVEGAMAEAIDAINAVGTPVCAIDIPSGLAADSGAVLGTAIRAALTVTFIGAKRGLYTGAAIDHAGTVLFDTLDVPAEIYRGVGPVTTMCDVDALRAGLPGRAPAAHKGDAGHVLVVGGGPGFGGAARLSGEAALRVGAGLVTVATDPGHVPGLLGGCPALMVHGIADVQALEPLLERADVVALGPGLGRTQWSRDLLDKVLDTLPGSLVIDADGLNLLAERGRSLGADPLLTPHPGEAARLLGTTVTAVQDDRFDACTRLAGQFEATVLLKGAGTLVAAHGHETAWLVAGAQPALAVGGSGDVLTGIAAGLRAQGLATMEAARLAAVLLTATAGRAAKRLGTRGVLPTDLVAALGPELAHRVRD